MSVIAESKMSVATEIESILEIPASTLNAMGSINLVNTGTTDAVVTVFVSKVANPTDEHAVEWELPLSPRQLLSRSCGPLAAGESIFVLSTTSTVAVRATAIVEAM